MYIYSYILAFVDNS